MIEPRKDGISEECPRHALLIYTNPFPRSVGSLRAIGRGLVAQGAKVDAIDAFAHMSAHLPYLTARDRLYESFAAKYRRFIVPVINGRDLTSDIHLGRIDGSLVPETIDELRLARAQGARVGLAALSSAASLTQIAARSSSAQYGSVLEGFWHVAHRAATMAALIPKIYDAVYIFNGRHAETRPFCDVLQEHAQVFRYEAGKVADSYILFAGSLFEVEDVVRRIQGSRVDVAAGVTYFESLRSRKPGTDAHRFTSGQKVGTIPSALSGKNFFAMFSSSDDEFFAIHDKVSFGEFETQNEVALAIAAICQAKSGKLALRLHPHLALKNDAWQQDWAFDQLRAMGAEVIMPDQPIDSYALVDAAEGVITCGSTIGIEAAYGGKPSLMVGDHYAGRLGICRVATDAAGIANFLDYPTKLPDASRQAVLLGSYMQTAGVPITGLRSGDDPTQARIDGRVVDPLRRVIAKVKSGVERS